MKKMRKGKKMLLILLIAILAIIVILAVVNIVRNIIGSSETPEDTNPVIILPETTYSDMEVKNVQMEYLKDNDETVISMSINNTTQNLVQDERVNVVWIGPNETVLGQLETLITKLDVGEQYEIEVILKGDLTATERINLIKK